MTRATNTAMTASNNIEGDSTSIIDSRGRHIQTVSATIARKLVDSGAYYLVTTQDISFI